MTWYDGIRYRKFGGRRYTLDCRRPTKKLAEARTRDQKRYAFKNARVVKYGDEWLVYVHGRK